MGTKKLRSKIEMNINEFCDKCKLEKYRSIVSSIINQIEVDGCRISAVYQGPSRYSKNFENGDKYIQIPVVRDPLETIWDIFHEYGHFKSNKHDKLKLTISERLENERCAWEYAKDEIKKYFTSHEHLSHFEDYKFRCLASYILADQMVRERKSK